MQSHSLHNEIKQKMLKTMTSQPTKPISMPIEEVSPRIETERIPAIDCGEPDPTTVVEEKKSQSTLMDQNETSAETKKQETPNFKKEPEEKETEELKGVPSTWSQLNESLLNLNDSPTKIPSQYTPL